MTQPTLVVWVLYDATTDVKYIKMNPSDGSLAIFDTEEAAIGRTLISATLRTQSFMKTTQKLSGSKNL